MRNFKYPKIFPKKCFLVIENIQKLSCFENIESNRAPVCLQERVDCHFKTQSNIIPIECNLTENPGFCIWHSICLFDCHWLVVNRFVLFWIPSFEMPKFWSFNKNQKRRCLCFCLFLLPWSFNINHYYPSERAILDINKMTHMTNC